MSTRVISVKKDILGANKEAADRIRNSLDRHHTRMVNIMSSPGSGKTSLIMQTIKRFKDSINIAVIEGDVASSIDADKINEQSVPALQINTYGGCHLDANMIANALDQFDLAQTDLVLVENVGNLVCTADFDLGAHKNVIILSVPEGDDKPHKYPSMFMASDVVLVNKIDVLPYFDFNLAEFPQVIAKYNSGAEIFPVSTKTGEGLDLWFSWLEKIVIPADEPGSSGVNH